MFTPTSPDLIVLAARIIQAVDLAIREDFETLRNSYFHFLLWMTGLVALGLLMEAPEIWHDVVSFFKRSNEDAPPRAKLAAAVGWLLIIVGVAGEGVAEALVSNADGLLQTFNNIMLSEASTDAGSARVSALAAAQAASRANAELDKAEKKLGVITQRADEIDRGLENTKWMISRMFVQDLNGLAGELKNQFKGRQIVLKSYSGDESAYWTCEQLVDIAHKAEMNPQDRCASEPVPNVPVVDILVGAPSLQEAERVSSLLTKPGRLAVLSVSLNQTAPVLSVMVGKKRSFVVWPPTKDDSKHRATKTSVKP